MEDLEDERVYLHHKRAIIYIDTDLLSLLSEVGDQPAALRWEDKVLACNNVARSYGVLENLSFKSAVEVCPGLIVLGGEHIKPLSEMVNQVNKLLRSYSCSLERLNVDECYLDVTHHPLLMSARNSASQVFNEEDCPCGCSGVLAAARLLGSQLQTALLTSLRVRSCFGVSFTKQLARLAAVRSSEQCCVILPDELRHLLMEENIVDVLPGKLADTLKFTTADIGKLDVNGLHKEVGLADSETVNTACGVDFNPVVTCDLWHSFCVQYEIREKFCVLLARIFGLVEEDGRTPVALKVSVRKSDPVRKTCSKETKTVPISCIVSCYARQPPEVISKLLNVIMTCFRRLVDMTRPFHLSLLGLAFVRFREFSPRLAHPPVRSVASCLMRKRELSVEVPVSIAFEGDGSSSFTSPRNIDQHDYSDVEEQPQNEKKAKLDIFIKSKRFSDESMDVCSPNKLKVGDLSLSEDKTTPHGLLHC